MQGYANYRTFHMKILIIGLAQMMIFASNPPLGVEIIWEFQEFQELETTQSNFKRRKSAAKIKRRKMSDRRAFVLFRT